MSRILNIAVEVTDAEFSAFIERLGTRGVVQGGPASVATDEDEGPANTAAPAVDSRGVPWIESVHAATKGVTADGAWRRRKGVTAEAMEAAEKAWRDSQPAPTFTLPASLSGTGQAEQIPVGTTPLPGVGLPGATPLPGMTPPPVPVTYEDIGAKYQALAAAGKITPETMGQYYAKHGVTDVNVLMNNEAVRTALMNDLNLLG